MIAKRIDDGLMFCLKCNDYTEHYHWLSERPRYCNNCGTEWKRGK